MKVPYSVQCALFAPAFIATVFALRMICPASWGEGCFADPLAVPLFMPVAFVDIVWSSSAIIASNEILFMTLYWSLVGFLVGLLIDIFRKPGQYTDPSQY